MKNSVHLLYKKNAFPVNDLNASVFHLQAEVLFVTPNLCSSKKCNFHVYIIVLSFNSPEPKAYR